MSIKKLSVLSCLCLVPISVYSMHDDAFDQLSIEGAQLERIFTDSSRQSMNASPLSDSSIEQEILEPKCPRTPRFENEIPNIGGEMNRHTRSLAIKEAEERVSRNQTKRIAHEQAMQQYILQMGVYREQLKQQADKRALKAARAQVAVAASAQAQQEEAKKVEQRKAEVAAMLKVVASRTKL